MLERVREGAELACEERVDRVHPRQQRRLREAEVQAARDREDAPRGILQEQGEPENRKAREEGPGQARRGIRASMSVPAGGGRAGGSARRGGGGRRCGSRGAAVRGSPGSPPGARPRPGALSSNTTPRSPPATGSPGTRRIEREGTVGTRPA